MEFGTHLGWLKSDPLHELRAVGAQLLKTGTKLVDLSMINPDLPPPTLLVDKLMESSIKPGNHRYAVSRGIRKLREAFAEKYATKFRMRLNPESEICVTMGTKDALVETLHVLKAPGGKVLLPTPTYPAHLSAAQVTHLIPLFFPMDKEEAILTGTILKCMEANPGSILLLNFPNNPTGRTVSEDFFVSLAKAAEKYDCFIVNDFVYGEMKFNGQSPSLLGAMGTARACETYSLSKAYNVPGWRVGALLGNEQVINQVSKLKSYIDYGIFLPIQIAAISALTSSEDLVAPTRSHYQARCRLLVSLLNQKGFETVMPEAGAFVWSKLPKGTGAEFAIELLRRSGVMVTPGELFGDEFKDRIRIAAVAPERTLHEIVGLMGEI